MIRKGIVRVFSISAQGDEQIVTFHVAGEFFPSSWIFDKAPGTLFFYEAVTDCEIAFCPRTELVQFMKATPERYNALLDYFTTNYAAWMIRVNALEQPKARDKLTYTLYYLCQRYSRENGRSVKIPLTLTHQNFASLVGLTRETIAIEMNKLKREGVIDYKQRDARPNFHIYCHLTHGRCINPTSNQLVSPLSPYCSSVCLVCHSRNKEKSRVKALNPSPTGEHQCRR